MARVETSDLNVKQKTMYDTMEFTPYEFSEWPQAIPVQDGKVMPTPYITEGRLKGKLHDVVIVNSQAELDALQGPQVKVVPVNPDAASGPLRVETEDDLRAELYVQAEQVGAQIDKSWSVERIEAAIKKQAQKNKPAADVV